MPLQDVPSQDVTDAPSRPLSLQWWTRDRSGRVAVAQPPSPALLVWFTAVVLGWTGALDGSRADLVVGIGHGALLVWALDELARGASPFRRLLGGVVLTVKLVSLFG